MRHSTKFLLCFLALVVFLSLSYAQEIPEKSTTPAEVDLITEKGKDSIVSVGGRGSGFFITKDKIATNFHIAMRFKRGPVFVKSWDKKTIWRVEGVNAFDIKSDIAILKVASEGIPLPLGDSDALQIGEPVFLVGYPYGKYKGTAGVVTGIRQNDGGIRTTIEAYPGNSGSPLLNSKGEVIGIHYGHDPGNSPVNTIKTLLAGATSTKSFTQWRKQKRIRAHFYTEQGKAKYHDRDAKGAIEDYNQAIGLNPDDAESYKFRAKAKAKLGDHEGALDDFNQAIKLHPDDAEIYKDRAKAKSDFGDHTGAVEDYNHAIKINPDDVAAFIKRGDAKGQLGDNAGKIADYSQAVQLKSDAVQLKPDDANRYNELGHMKQAIGDHAGAIEDFTQAIKLKPDDAYGYNNRGWAKRELGDHVGAIDDFTQAIKLKPNDAYGYKNRAAAKKILDNHIGAIEDYNQAIKLKPDDANAYNQRGWAKRKLDDHTGAIEDFTQAMKLKPDDAYVYTNRAPVREILGDYDGAIEDWTQAIKLEPNNVAAYKERGDVKRKLDDYQGAIEDFTEAIRLDPQDLGANLSIAEYYRDKGMLDKAGEHIQKTGLITEDSWTVLGPFDNKDRIGFDAAYIPEDATHIDTTVKYDTVDGKAGWQKCSDDKLDGNIRFGKDVDWRVAYAFTTVTSPDEREVQFRFDSDDQGKVWLNGVEVYAHTETHKAIMDRYIFSVTLKKGKNSILVKVCEEKGGWGFYLRITDKNGQAFDDLEINRAMQIGE